jgi:hypothetical protein
MPFQHITLLINQGMSQDGAVSILTRLQAGQSAVPILAGTGNFLLLQNDQPSFGIHPASYSVGTGVLS